MADRNDTEPTRTAGGPLKLTLIAIMVALVVVALVLLFAGN